MLNNINEPFVAQRYNGQVINFPHGGYLHYFPNRKYRRNVHKNEHQNAKKQLIIIKWDYVRNKPLKTKTIYHYL